ncbi:hypothetical protein [Paraburkholderia bryophila]|uniref:Uncharacterized protein n=1 Tax=Paraburkholderia bryophila TaxID=420952 RepID=A0A7Y9WSH5_9BURK|nr:hypothetical protein [Paraburkholderia bryophila]NYH26324.1 hypothetical protein [Paraburkholderia bryophila]
MLKLSRMMWATVIGTSAIMCAVAVNHRQVALESREEITTASNSTANGWGNPFPASSPAYREAEKYHHWLMTGKNLDIARGTTGSFEHSIALGQLVAKGMARLPTALLEEDLPVLAKILNSLDDKVCSSLLRGELSLSDLGPHAYPVMDLFSDAEAKTWFATNRAAIEAQLNNLPAVTLTKEHAKQAILNLATSLPGDRSQSFLLELAGLRTASDHKACATIQTLYSQSASLSEPYRGYMARLLLTGKDGQANF